MDEISFVVQLFNNLLSNDSGTISQADREIQELFRNDPNSLSQIMITILQDYQNYTLEIVLYCFIFLRKIFFNATNTLKTQNELLAYSLIPQETANSYIPLILSFFTIENSQINYYSSLLLGQIAIYMLNYDSDHPLLLSLIQQIDEGNQISPSLESINFILSDGFDLFEKNVDFHQEFMNKISTWLCDENFPFELKPTLIKMIIIFVPYLSGILKTEEGNETFIQMMFALTQVNEFKFDSYEFWSNLAVEIPQLLICSNTSIAELSITDLEERLSKYPNLDEEDEKISLQILHFWSNFAWAEEEDPESTSKIVESVIPSFLPFLLVNAEKFIDLNILPINEDYSIFTSIIFLVNQISSRFNEISIPILIKFGLETLESENLSEKVTGFYAINNAIFLFSGESEDESAFCTQCINISLDLIGTDFDDQNNGMIRIVSQAVENVYNIAYLYPNLIDYSSLIPRLVELMKSPIFYNSETLILQIAKMNKLDSSSLLELINALFEVQNIEAFNLIYKILEIYCKHLQESDMKEIITQELPKAFSIISQIVEQNSDDEEINILLNPLLSIITLGINFNNDIIAENYENFIQIIINCYKDFQNSQAIRILAISTKIANDMEHMQYTINQIILQFDNGDNDNMISSCLDALIFDLKSVDLSEPFGELMRSLLQLQEHSNNNMIKIMILGAINSLYESFPLLMQPYITRLIPLFGSAAVCFKRIGEQKGDLLKELLKASLLLVQNIYQEDESNQENTVMEQCLQVSYSSIQCFLYLNPVNYEIIMLFFDLLNELIAKNPIFANKILHEIELLNYIQEQSRDSSDQSFPSLSSIIQFLNEN